MRERRVRENIHRCVVNVVNVGDYIGGGGSKKN